MKKQLQALWAKNISDYRTQNAAKGIVIPEKNFALDFYRCVSPFIDPMLRKFIPSHVVFPAGADWIERQFSSASWLSKNRYNLTPATLHMMWFVRAFLLSFVGEGKFVTRDNVVNIIAAYHHQGANAKVAEKGKGKVIKLRD